MASGSSQPTYPQWLSDGKPRPLRAAILRRRAARRVGSRAPEIMPGDCGPCAGWGVVGNVRCLRCDGSGYRRVRPLPRGGGAP